MARATRKKRPDEARSPAANAAARPEARAQGGVAQLQAAAGNRAVARAIAHGGGHLIQRINTSSIKDLAAQGGRPAHSPGLAAYAALMAQMAARNAQAHVGYGDHLGPGDALRHCTWAGLVMQQAIEEHARAGDGAEAIGTPQERALSVLMAHEEAEGGADTKDSLMDQYNNAQGMKLAEELWAAGKRSREEILAGARERLDGGELIMFDRSGAFIPTAAWQEMPKDTWDPGKYLDEHGAAVTPPSEGETE